MTAVDAPDLDRTRVEIRTGPLVGPVLSRLVALHGARVPLGVDRLGDAMVIADTLAAQAPAYLLGDRLPVGIRTSGTGLELRVGPLRSGGGQGLLGSSALPGTGNVLQRLADDVRVRPGRRGTEYLVLQVNAA